MADWLNFGGAANGFAGAFDPPANWPPPADWKALLVALPLSLDWNPGRPPPLDVLKDFAVEKFEFPVSVPPTVAILFSGLGSTTGTSSAWLVCVSVVSLFAATSVFSCWFLIECITANDPKPKKRPTAVILRTSAFVNRFRVAISGILAKKKGPCISKNALSFRRIRYFRGLGIAKSWLR